MTRFGAALVLLALGSPAAAQDSPPFTMQFEHALQAYGDCLRTTEDRYPAAIAADEAARGAIAACEGAFQQVEAQLAADYVSRRGLSTKHAAGAAANAMQT